MIDETKLLTRTGTYRFATSGAVTDKVLLDVAAQYDMQLKPKFLSVSAKEVAKRFAGDEKLLETTKYDGEGVFIYFEAEKNPFQIFAFSAPSGRVRLGFPALDALARQLAKQKVKRALLRAELYLPGQIGGKRTPVSEVIRASFSGSEAELAQLRLAVFDIIMLDGKDLRSAPDFSATWDTLGKLAGTDESAPAHRAAGSIVAEKEVARILSEKTGSGLEGLVLRRLSRTELYKVKPQVNVDAVVVGYVEGEFEGNYGVLSLLTALTYGDKGAPTHFQIVARVGSGFTDQMRTELLQILQPLRMAAPIAMTDSDGRTVQFLKPQIIAELEATDIVTASRADRENTTQLLTWGTEWAFAGMTPFPRLVFPTLSRIRSDKEVAAGGARISQILPGVTEPPKLSGGSARRATTIRREVWTKEQKGETMVRKLTVIEIADDPESFPYAIYWTDFSPKRKDPLKVDAAFATTGARAHALAEQFVAEGIAKGWVKSE